MSPPMKEGFLGSEKDPPGVTNTLASAGRGPCGSSLASVGATVVLRLLLLLLLVLPDVVEAVELRLFVLPFCLWNRLVVSSLGPSLFVRCRLEISLAAVAPDDALGPLPLVASSRRFEHGELCADLAVRGRLDDEWWRRCCWWGAFWGLCALLVFGTCSKALPICESE